MSKETKTTSDSVQAGIEVVESPNEKFERIWNALSEPERKLTRLLPYVVELPFGSSLDSLLHSRKDANRISLVRFLKKLQLEGLVASSHNWVWVVNSKFVQYLVAEGGVAPPVALPHRTEKIALNTDNGRSYLFGSITMFKFVNDNWTSEETMFDINITGKTPLPEFEYRKPLVGNQFFEEPTEFEVSTRSGYLPLATARDVRRPPGHLYQDENILVTAINMGKDNKPDWQIRCFPQSCIPESTWDEAEERLKK